MKQTSSICKELQISSTFPNVNKVNNTRKRDRRGRGRTGKERERVRVREREREEGGKEVEGESNNDLFFFFVKLRVLCRRLTKIKAVTLKTSPKSFV